MSSVSGVNNTSYSSYSSYGKLASGKALTSAADGAAELAIAEKEESQVTGYDVGANNAASAKDMLNVSDGALGSINDHLQRMRELALQATNGLLTDSDKANIQVEVDQLKQGIADIANNTSFNTQKLLDGSKTDWQLATDANGSETTVNTVNATLSELGIEDFDVTKDFDLKTLDDALQKVSDSRAKIGAQTNGLEYTINYNKIASENTTAAASRLEDLDMGKAVSDMKKNELLDTYKLMMQKKKQEDEANSKKNLLDSMQIK